MSDIFKHILAILAALFACYIFVYSFKAITIANGEQNPALVVFDIVPFVRPPLLLDSTFFEESLNPVQIQNQPAPVKNVISAKAYLVGNIATGKVYSSLREGIPMPLASMSKLITAITAKDVMSGDTPVEITEDDMDLPPDSSYLQAHEKMTVAELMYPMLLSSSNIAAEAVARSVDRSQFIASMNRYAKEIGMDSAHFGDPSGLDSANIASAHDMFYLARYLYNKHKDILAITHTPDMIIATTTLHGSHQLLSTHPFVYDGRFVGGKTGRTPAAGETMMTILTIDKQPIVFIVLGSAYGGREWDTQILINRYIEKYGKRSGAAVSSN